MVMSDGVIMGTTHEADKLTEVINFYVNLETKIPDKTTREERHIEVMNIGNCRPKVKPLTKP